jgi:integrase
MARLLANSSLNLELTLHSLRHTHISLLAEAAVGSNKLWIDLAIQMIKSPRMSISTLQKK